MKYIETPKDMQDFIETLIAVLQAPVAQNLTIEDMRNRFRAVDRLEPQKGALVIELEDADHQTVLAALEGAPYRQAHRDIVKVSDALRAAKSELIVDDTEKK